MQDISLVPAWNREEVISGLEKTPLDLKTMKSKLDKIYQISSYTELQYVQDVMDAYTWIKLANQYEHFKKCLAFEKTQRQFSEEFVPLAIRYMIICKKFKNKVMMVLTQQIMVESLKFYVKNFDTLEKYPKMSTILKNCFESDKQFYKLNYINEFTHLLPIVGTEEIQRIDQFINELKTGDRVDVLKTQMHSKRICWLPATVRKVTSLSIHLNIDFQKGTHTVDRKSMTVFPPGQKLQFYQWRLQLKAEDKIDLQDSNGNWIEGTITERREIQDSEKPEIKLIDLKIQCECVDIEWLSITDAKIQKHGILTKQPGTKLDRSISESFIDDFNDIIFDPEMKNLVICRPDVCKSTFLIDLINYANNDLKLFDLILNAVKNRKFNIEVTSQLIAIIALMHPLFHRKFAFQYLNEITKGILDYVIKSDDIMIRNFSKERYEAVLTSINEFLKRLSSTSERKRVCQNFQLDLILRFLNSDFLDRKLYSITQLTSFLKLSKHNTLNRTLKEFLEWINKNKIILTIYNEKSHAELINRSADFLQFYLMTQPHVQELAPLLQWNQAIIKLINDSFQYFPEEFREKIVIKIKEKKNVTNKDALEIIKRTTGCEIWLLENGGESWVSVVKEKTKRKSDIVEVFKYPFSVVEKITKQIAQIFECKFKTEYFIHLHDINYLSEVMKNQAIKIQERISFAALTIDPLSSITEDIFNSLLPYTTKVNDLLPTEFQEFFVNLLYKMSKKHVNQLFQNNFSEKQMLETIGAGQVNLFKNCFLLINEEKRNIEKKVAYHFPTPHSYKKQKKQILTIKVNPNELIGMKELMTIIFENKNIAVTQIALQFIGFLFDHLAKDLQESVVEFKSKFLESCLEQFYKTVDQQEKYLKIIEKLMNESEKEGCDVEPSVNALFPSQTISLKIIDHFNVNKSKMIMEVHSNLTLYELRAQIARHINAYVNEFKIMINEVELDPRFNGQVIHTLDLSSGDLVLEKKVTIDKIGLAEPDGNLTEKCKTVLRMMFKQYSTSGLMSKPQCQKYHQRCVGEVSSMSQSKVDKIYQSYDEDKDGYLTEPDFLKFYQYSVNSRQAAVWSNLETFGIRNDLEILYDKEIQYPDPANLTRTLLFQNQKFITLLLQILQSNEEQVSASAWKIISRLPLIPEAVFFGQEKIDLQKKYTFRYWLYEVDYLSKYELITKQILQKIIKSDIETVCIGLKVAIHSSQFNVNIFNKTVTNLKKINNKQNLNFYSKVVLDNTLKIIDAFIKENQDIEQHYISNHDEYDAILTTGLMSKNAEIRKMHCEAIEEIITTTVQSNFEIFEIFFSLIYKNFQKCDKSTLTIQYFDLYSNLLQILKIHNDLLPKLKLNWLILTKSMIELYIQHRCTESSLNSKPDQVAQGFLRIIRKLLDQNTVAEMIPLVKFIFQHSLFPETGQNKLKNSKSRKDAYELIYQICKIKGEGQNSLGLRELFNSGFKSVYKKMSQNKPTTYSLASYFYSYNEARSELGFAGIRNLGCICYMIAMLQQLFMTKPFRHLILMADDGQPECLVKKGNKEIDDNIFHQFQIMFANLELTEKQEYNPDQFCFSFKDFEGNPVNVSVQQDSQEFLNLFFDKLETSLKGSPFKNIFEGIFGGKTCNQTVCHNCKAIKERQQNFYPLSLEIKGYKGIEDSFKKFIQGEVISDYQCDFCNKKADVTKSCYLAKVPNHFIIHLQRMCFNYDKFENEKVNSRWEFPLKLNVYDYSLDKQKNINSKEQYEFSLKGIVLHYGSADFGHYFSYIKENQNLWIEFNDERVREFDPRDIQSDCFGGQHWRRESQSAYLLVYEKVLKREIKLEFSNQEQKAQIINKFNLTEAIVEKVEISEESKKVQEEKEKQSQQVVQGSEQVQKEQKKIPVFINESLISSFISEDMKAKINKANEQFSFTINLSNDQFAFFIHKILSIDPPSELTTEYLELCYECFHLKQIIDEGQGSNLSQWAAKRFKEIIKGHGWQFLKIFGQNWESDILNIERNTRIGMKNLLQCVISDIIKSSGLNDEVVVKHEEAEIEQLEQKKNIVVNFLNVYTEMMHGDVAKNWIRLKQYFEVWIALVAENQYVRNYCQEYRMIEKLLDFVLEDYSPFPRNFKRYPLSNQHYSAEFQFPLEFMTLLIKHGYTLNQMEKKCMKNYAFMEKIIKFPTKHFNLVEFICHENQVLSERFAYLVLIEASKVNQSDEIKPIIHSIHKFVEIKDDIQALRLEWILGYAQYVENPKTGSYGVFGINPDQDVIVNYVSALRATPILQQIIKFKNKYQHVAALLVAMLLQLEADGHITNLEEYTSLIAFTENYTYWFEEFVESYYDDTHRSSFIAKHYIEYGNKIKTLWVNRPKRQFTRHQPFLIGKTTLKETIKEVQINQMIEVAYIDVTSTLLPLDQENAFLNKKNVKNFTKSENFRVKNVTSYGHAFLNADRLNNSSDEEQLLTQKPTVNPFDKVIQGKLFRRILIKNISYENLLLVVKIKSESAALSNIFKCKSDISFEIKGESIFPITLMKKDIDQPFDEIQLEFKVLGKATREGFWPRQLITEVPQEKIEEEKESSDNQQEEHTWGL